MRIFDNLIPADEAGKQQFFKINKNNREKNSSIPPFHMNLIGSVALSDCGFAEIKTHSGSWKIGKIIN